MLRKRFIWLIAIVYSYGSLPYDCRMASDRSPQTADKYILRFPDGMRDRIADEAKKNNRSMNAEIVHILMGHFDQKDEEAEDRKNGVEQEHKVGLSIGMNDPRDRAAALKVLLLKELMLLKRRVDQLGGRDSVLSMDIADIAKTVEGGLISGTEGERKSYFSTIVASTPLTAVLTTDEIDKIAARLAQIESPAKKNGGKIDD